MEYEAKEHDFLAALLGSSNVNSFLSEIWGKRYFFRQGGPERVAQLLGRPFDKGDLLEATRQTAERNPKQLRVYASSSRKESVHGAPRRGLRAVDHRDIEQVLLEGASVLVENLADTHLADFANNWRICLGHMGSIQIRSTITPLGGRHTPHVDPTCSLFIHCQGEKKFRISPRPVIQAPIDSAVLTHQGALKWNNHSPSNWEVREGIDETEFIEITMRPGDILYFPAGTVHATEAMTDDCAGINFQFAHVDVFQIIAPVLRRHLLENPTWRRVPVLPRPSSSRKGTISVDFIAERLAELQAAVDSLRAEEFNV
ncbi:JmjC domain-containing protein [Streptomyces sp. NPDC059688]|uniref:JmjC domain-containing protein n=1 Tax=Streptomyces sp. NPDC059688 TaxID=3346906 RepID=UPI0036ADF9B0